MKIEFAQFGGLKLLCAPNEIELMLFILESLDCFTSENPKDQAVVQYFLHLVEKEQGTVQ